jgi:hypothetical protein
MDNNTEINSGTDVATETANATPTEEVKQETSATSPETTAPEGEGNVTEAEKDETTETKAGEEGGDKVSTEGYTMNDVVFPDGFTVTDEEKAAFKTELDAIGVKDKEMAQSFLNWILEKNKQADEVFAKQQEKDVNDLEAKWIEEGKRDPELGKEYDRNVSEAMTLAGKIFSPRTVDFLKDTKFSSNPDFLKDMLRLAKERADAELVGGKGQTTSSGVKRDSYGNPMLVFNE